MKKAIIVKNVSKKYILYNSTKERLLGLISSKGIGEPFYALRNVNFEADHGEVIGFVGINGSGKSTLSNIIAGILPETEGSVEIDGQAALIAVAAGLKNDLTGRDNIELKLLMLGFNKQEIKDLEQDIIEFSELEKFIDQPVKSYSSGMKSRLGFSISVNVNPEILIIDEALSVGDKAFAEKSLDKMKEFKAKGKTMIFVSHSIGQMKKFCDKILWLEFGKVKEYGTVGEIIPKYEEFLSVWKNMSKVERDKYREEATNDTLDYKKFIEKRKERIEKIIEERLISHIGRIKKEGSKIFSSVDISESTTASYDDINKTYYIKKVLFLGDKKYFLLSNHPSYKTGILGWVNEIDLDKKLLAYIDIDSKKFIIKGTGKAYDKPWGMKHDVVFDNLEPFANEFFHVTRTDKVGAGVWYFGLLGDKNVWINHKHLEDAN